MRWNWLCTLCCWYAMWSAALAQDGGLSSGDAGRSEEPVETVEPDAGAPELISGDLSPVEVTAQDSSPRVSGPHSPSEVVRTRETLLAAPHRTAGDMLLLVPGLFVTQHGGEGKGYQIFYRGFDAEHGRDLELWVGGAPVNDVSNIHGQGYADLHFVMPEVVRSLRATPGSYDPRQGDFAVAGTVRLDLGYHEEGATAKAQYGSFGSSRHFLSFRPKGFNEQTFAAAEVYSTDGFGPSRAAQRATAIAQGRFRLGDGLSLRVLATTYASHFDSAGVLRLSDIESRKVSRFHTYDASQGGDSARSQFVTELKHSDAHGEFSVSPYLVLRSMRLRQNFTGHLDDPSGDSQQQLNEDVVLGGTAYYRFNRHLFSERDAFEVGVFMRHDWIEQSQKRLATTDQTVTGQLVDARVRASNVAGYVDAALHPLSRLSIRGGLRVDGLFYATQDNGGEAQGQARSSQGAHLGKKGTLGLRIIDGLDALVSYGEGFRSPQARKLAESEGTPFTRVVSFEGGLRYRSAHVAASLAGFRTSLSDDLVFDQSTGRNERVNATVRVGGTADVTVAPLSWIHLVLNATFTKASFKNGGELVPYTPQVVSRADLGLTPVFGEWKRRKLQGQFGTGISYMARRPLPAAQVGHSIFLMDAQAGVRWGEGAVLLRGFNLLDANWYDGEFLFASNWSDPVAPTNTTGESIIPQRHVTVGAPRTLFVSLELYL